MKFIYVALILQSGGLFYLFSENADLKLQLIDSAETMSKSARTIERLIKEVNYYQLKLSDCAKTLDQYHREIDYSIEQP